MAIITTPIFKYFLTKNELASHAKQFGWVAGLLALVLYFLNYRKYDGKYDNYLLQWKDESPNKRFVKGIFVILSLSLPLISYLLIKLIGINNFNALSGTILP